MSAQDTIRLQLHSAVPCMLTYYSYLGGELNLLCVCICSVSMSIICACMYISIVCVIISGCCHSLMMICSPSESVLIDVCMYACMYGCMYVSM